MSAVLKRIRENGKIWRAAAISIRVTLLRLLSPVVYTVHMHERFMSTTVGYTMDKMYLSTLESPIEIDPGVVTPLPIVRRMILDCSQNYTSGT